MKRHERRRGREKKSEKEAERTKRAKENPRLTDVEMAWTWEGIRARKRKE